MPSYSLEQFMNEAGLLAGGGIRLDPAALDTMLGAVQEVSFGFPHPARTLYLHEYDGEFLRGVLYADDAETVQQQGFGSAQALGTVRIDWRRQRVEATDLAASPFEAAKLGGKRRAWREEEARLRSGSGYSSSPLASPGSKSSASSSSSLAPKCSE